MGKTHGVTAAVLALGLAGLSGCGTPGAPLPPSLNLPERVGDLSAVRAGGQVSLAWTMPAKNTDKLLLKENVAAAICRQEQDGACEAVKTEPSLAPGAACTYTDKLPAALTSGPPRPLRYFVELKNRKGRSAGWSNAGVVLAGEAPAPVTGLTAEIHKRGVVLSWTPGVAGAIRLRRTLLTPPAAKPKEGLLTPPPQPVEQNLLVEAGAQNGRAIDKDIRFDETYEYRAQRVIRVTVDGRVRELDSAFSAPVRLEAKDIFPPAVPTGLAAVATPPENGAGAAIDLSWQPGTENDLAGYVVYRREADEEWKRISPAAPVVGPAFHDDHVQPGHTYHYAVSAVSQSGHESARSAETQETVPEP